MFSLFTRGPDRDVAAWTRAADDVVLPPLDEVGGGHVRPPHLGTTYAECEYHALADEQVAAWDAEGERAARSAEQTAHGTAPEATAAYRLVELHAEALQQAQAGYQHAARVLTPYVRREPGAKLRYWVCWIILVLGDMTGVWAAAVMFGEVPAIAFGQALASGVAAGCAGLVGTEVKHLRMARMRARDVESLDDEERRYQRLFTGADRGVGLVGVVALLSLVVVILLGVGVFILRTATEGSVAAGLMFGCLAVVTALGSFLVGFASADEVADVLAALRKRTHQAERRYQRAAGASVLRTQAAATVQARSIRAEHQARGRAAARRVEALSWRVQRNNAPVLGHGFATDEAGGVIGRRRRPDGAL